MPSSFWCKVVALVICLCHLNSSCLGQDSSRGADIDGTLCAGSLDTAELKEPPRRCPLGDGREKDPSSNSISRQRKQKPIQVLIKSPTNGSLDLGATLTIECKFDTSLDQELKFKLRWLRSVGDSRANQSISTHTDVDSVTIIAATTRVWTVQRSGGLDLELQDFQAEDAGDYFCQAVSLEPGDSNRVLSESRIRLTPKQAPSSRRPDVDEDEEVGEAAHYSHENLLKLLPSLRVEPEFLEVAPGEQTSFVCATSELDPDPELGDFEWTFEGVDRTRLLEPVSPVGLRQLPTNVSAIGNLLQVWWASHENSGLFRCSVKVAGFSLAAEATAELLVRAHSDSAPLVFVAPESVRLQPNASAQIQCESTGFPAPQLVWYRVEAPDGEPKTRRTRQLLDGAQQELEELGVEIAHVAARDARFYCEHNKCAASDSQPVASVTAVSLLRVEGARGQHQGQYVCRASNKHGSNQASSLVDVDLNEPPLVAIGEQYREQSVVLDPSNKTPARVTFKCSIVAGRPRPKLRWLRTSSAEQAKSARNLDLLDLTHVSSVTSNVSTWLEEGGRTLVLELSTFSLDDEGDYACLGENERARHSALARLHLRRPVSVRIQQASPMLARLNDSFHLDCLASGHPAPLDMEWSRQERGAFFAPIARSSSPLGSHERAVLKFDRLTRDEAGEYTCQARDPLNSSLVVRDTIMLLVDEPAPAPDLALGGRPSASLLPRLMIRPARLTAPPGSDVTLDCLAVGGLQPTLVEWAAPQLAGSARDSAPAPTTPPSVRPFYRDAEVALAGRIVQLGSKLRIFNVSKAHEGVYQCKGTNKVGAELAPALVRVLEPLAHETAASPPGVSQTKVARVGANIELKCQVNDGLEQPATSWSRDGLELPAGSVQIERNLWIQNVSSQDGGLYVCSARAPQPKRVIQAKVRLLVRAPGELASPPAAVSAKIVASKASLAPGDSVTLECIVGGQNASAPAEPDERDSASSLEQLERQVVWTNADSAEGSFQENVYAQDNLLIIYELRPENAATYRCNYNELSQHVDHTLQVGGSAESSGEPANATLQASNGRRALLRQVPLGSFVSLECAGLASRANASYFWTRGNEEARRVGADSRPLVLQSARPDDADIYHCRTADGAEPWSVLLHVHVPAARFLQRPVSFASLAAISGADQQLELELKFLPERDHGLLLFSGRTRGSSPGDYISLGLHRAHLEFRFELGDGTTLLRSHKPLALNQWHKVLIERNRRGALMWLDGEPPVSNSSTGKFFNLNLDSVLFVGGHEHFLNKSRTSRFFGFARGFQGCVSSLRVSRLQLDLLARNGSASIGLHDCDKPECARDFCPSPDSVCQPSAGRSSGLEPARRTEPTADLRCICLPGLAGDRCQRPASPAAPPRPASGQLGATSPTPPPSSVPVGPKQGSCDSLKPCADNGTLSCDSLTSVSYRCHCKLGFVGESCSRPAAFNNETSVAFNPLAYVQLRFNRPEEALVLWNQQARADKEPFNATQFAKLTSMAEEQSVSFRVRTKSSYGLIFYTGQATLLNAAGAAAAELAAQTQGSKSMVANLLARLSNIVLDYFAIALVDGHVELSYELGSGVAILRSSHRVNDGAEHSIAVTRSGKLARLTIDQRHRHEGASPGKLRVLNSQPDIYLAGLPHLAELTNNMYVSGFVGCLSHLEINTLGPLNLVRSDHLTQLKAARNLAPCPTNATEPVSPPARPKPYQSPTPSSDSDDPDEL